MTKYHALETDIVRHWQAGGADAHGQVPQRAVSDGQGNPCRHCLREIPETAEMLILAHRPFETLHPYAECGPVFVCAAPCNRADPDAVPQILTTSPDYLVKGYSGDERIVYGTGAVVPAGDIAGKAAITFEDPRVAFIHVRSARNNCYQLRLDRYGRNQ
ncbi:DUF1203 domain-containing protein [Roseobacter ponti]|uniref:DUF1203 domain-containing protein n=1 Tax=Roseobacter ponti TaxID=1891787 RepID=A0A858SLP8_9RHOB|nr:DUF1203 domain-containing protein [Roseobacter ponti]QJF49829.1 DUF1203 domain-containing protein [Roseobacter ponti]